MRRVIVSGWVVVALLGLVSGPGRAQEKLATPSPASEGEARGLETPPVVAEPANSAEGSSEDWRSGDIFIHAEALLMVPRRRALDFAIVDPNTDGMPQGPIESVFWNMNAGVRAGIGYRLAESGWDFGAFHTYFHSKNNRFLQKPTGGTLYATLTHPGFVDAVDTALGSSNINYNVLDAEFGRRLEAGNGFSVRLMGGGRFAWIDQNLLAFYNGQSASFSVLNSYVNFNGAGVRVGGEGQWEVGRGFGFYARAAGSLLYGDFRTSLVETNNSGATFITNVTERFRKVVPVTELGIGVGWQGRSVRARVGYELTNWIGMVDSPDFIHDYTNKLGHRVSDLSLDGLVLQVEFTF